MFILFTLVIPIFLSLAIFTFVAIVKIWEAFNRKGKDEREDDSIVLLVLLLPWTWF